VRLALTTSIAVYGAWFWAEGVQDGLIAAEDPLCRKITTWFFHPFDISGGIHILYIVMTVGTATFYGTMCAAAVIAFVANLAGGWKQRVQFETGFSHREYVSSLVSYFRADIKQPAAHFPGPGRL
jgi:hypothetical protein